MSWPHRVLIALVVTGAAGLILSLRDPWAEIMAVFFTAMASLWGMDYALRMRNGSREDHPDDT